MCGQILALASKPTVSRAVL